MSAPARTIAVRGAAPYDVVVGRDVLDRVADLLGDGLSMLMDGAWASLPYLGPERAGLVARGGAEALLRNALPQSG